MYFLIQGWGSGKREFAAMKFFIYTAAGSAFLLASTLALAFIHQSDTGFLTFDFRVLAAWNGLSGTTEVLLFLGFLAAFAGAAFAQQPADEKPAAAPEGTKAATPSEATCAKDDALCILAESLKKKDPGTGSKSGISPGFIANQPAIPGSRLDLPFLQKNEIKG
jgi:hypothetical protein